MRHSLATLLLLGLCAYALGQADAQLNFSVRHFGVEEGLLHRRVNHVVQDRDGFLWLATPAGVQRFDGHRFINWTTAEGLSTNAVSTIWADADGLLWLVSKSFYSEGHISSIDILDPRTGKVASFAQHFGAKAPCTVEELADKALLLHDGSLLLSATGRLIRYRSAAAGSVTIPVRTDGILRPVAMVRDGTVWCVMFRPREEFLDLVKVDTTGTVTRVEEGPFSLGSVGRMEHGDLSAGAQGLHFIGGLRNGGLYEYLLSPDGALHRLPGVLDADDIFHWNGSLYLDLGEGLWLVDATVRQVPPGAAPRSAPVRSDMRKEHPEIGVGLHHAMRDRLGHIWVGSEFGLWQLSMRPDHFTRWLQRADTLTGPLRSFRGMVLLGDTLFAASENDGWYAVDIHSGAHRRLDDGSWQLRYAMEPDGQGGLWVGRSKELRHWRHGRLVRKPLELDRMPLCVLPFPDGRLLLGTRLGLAWTDTAFSGFSEFDAQPQAPMASAVVAQLFRDREGTIWVCTHRGLGELDANGELRAIWRQSDSTHHLPAEDFYNIHEDDDGIYWVSTATNGLLRWDRTTGDIRMITKADGLPSNGIYAVYPDARGMLWMPTDNGIARYDPATRQIRSYTTADGIAHNEFNRWSHTRGPDGRLYFGGLDGITVFHPDDLVDVPEPEQAPLLITGVQQFDGRLERLVDRTAAVVQERSITMRPLDRFFTLGVALLSYEKPGAVLYGWRVEGVDVDWNHQYEPTLRFASLPFGTHDLRIRAKGGRGEWTPELTLAIHVLRPWYWRWWAIALYVLAITAAVYALFRYRLSRVRAMVAMRDRIALDLHDEVGSTLSSVALFSTVMGNDTRERPAQEKAMLERIARNSAQAMEGMNDIVWSVNTRYEKLSDVEDRMLAYAGPIAEAKGWDLEIAVEEGMRDMRLSMNERKNLYLIFKEAVNNAAKYAQCDRVRVHLRRSQGRVELSVMDNGVGIGPAALGNGTLGGNGLRGMQQRATDIKGEFHIGALPEGGTVVTLRFKPHAE